MCPGLAAIRPTPPRSAKKKTIPQSVYDAIKEQIVARLG